MEQTAFREARRELQGLTAAVEKDVLWWLAARIPAAVGPDHLTALGLAAMVAAGAAYAWAAREPLALHLVNACLLVNWFGDSLDGTLARFRRTPRPRYGFYVDHLVDAVGALFLLGGLALSGLTSPAVAWGVLLVYYLLSIEIYLATYTRGTFKISYGLVGGTELRILLALANLVVWKAPRLVVTGRAVLLFDLVGVPAIVGLAAVVVTSALRNGRALHQEERTLRAGATMRP